MNVTLTNVPVTRVMLLRVVGVLTGLMALLVNVH